MPVILLLAALAVVAGIALAALGRGGEMAAFPGDFPPLEFGDITAADVALLRPPMALWGYNVRATEEALELIARSVTARDVEIATLRRELADLRGGEAGDFGQGRSLGPDPQDSELPPWPTRPAAGDD